MGGYISFAKFNKKHLYILYSILFLILKDFSFGFNYNDSFTPLFGGNNANENFSEHYLIKNILCYIFTFILSLILYVFERKKIEKNLSNKSENGDNALVSPSFSQIKYIHHVSKNIYLSNTSILFLLFIIFMWILNENLIQLFSILKDLDFWMIEIIIISYMTSFCFKTKIYIHHKMIIYLNLFPVIFKIFTIILSFKDNCNKGTENYYYCNCSTILDSSHVCLSKNKNVNRSDDSSSNKGLKNYYVMNPVLVPIGIIIYLVLITLRSYVNPSLKWLMDLKYISDKKLLMIYGIFGAIISFIICIITTFVECKNKDSKDSKPDIYNYICKVEYNNKLYFDNFLAIKYDWTSALKVVLGSIFFYFNKYFSMLIIKYLTPVHLIFSIPVYYFFLKMVLMINTLIWDGSFFSKNSIEYIGIKFSLDSLGDILSTIGFLIYLEIIELNFCGLNYYLRRKISERADDEKYENLGIEDDEDEDEVEGEGEIEKEDDKEMNNVNSK